MVVSIKNVENSFQLNWLYPLTIIWEFERKEESNFGGREIKRKKFHLKKCIFIKNINEYWSLIFF